MQATRELDDAMRKSNSVGCVKAALHSDKSIIVIKVGTSSLVRAEQLTLNLSNLARICDTIKALKSQGHHVIVVSSGAVGVGCQRLGLKSKPGNLAQKQALAAVGQVHLMRYYEDMLSALGLRCAQVLLTLDNLANRNQYLNARNTFTELLAYGTVPIVNENDTAALLSVNHAFMCKQDTVAVHELRFGDNDTLSAQVATLVEADWLFLLTDVPYLYTANPKDNPEARPIYEVDDLSKLTADTSTSGTQWGTGGMATKLTAARIATASGTTMVICLSSEPENIPRILCGEHCGTVFHPRTDALKGRKRWILSVPVRGQIWIDDGASRALQVKRKSLFSAGIREVKGNFNSQDGVSICDMNGVEFARGLSNFDSQDMRKVMGKQSKELHDLLGYHSSEEMLHRDNIVLLMTSDCCSDSVETSSDEGRKDADE